MFEHIFENFASIFRFALIGILCIWIIVLGLLGFGIYELVHHLL
jgi:hypothetical protein